MSMRTEGSSSYEHHAAEEFDVEDLHSRSQVRRVSLGPPPFTTTLEERLGFNLWKLLRLFGVLTIGITVPALSWYSAVPLTSMADITTIYNTYAVWALVFSIWFLGEKWEKVSCSSCNLWTCWSDGLLQRKVLSVLLACGGVVLVAYGGAEHRRRPREPDGGVGMPGGNSTTAAVLGMESLQEPRAGGAVGGGNAFLGDLLAFIGAVTMAAYEMAFKIVGTLPDEDAQRVRYERSRSNRNSRMSDYHEEGSVRAGSDTEGQGLLEQRTGEEDADEGDVVKEIARKSMEVERQEAAVDQSHEPSTERTGLWRPKESLDVNGTYQTISPAPEEEGDLGQASQDTFVSKGLKSVRIFDADDRVHGDIDGTIAALEGQRGARIQEWIPPPLPFGMHPILVTSGIGLVTLCTLWIGLPIAHSLGWEPFEAPANFKTAFFIFLVVFTGIIFNGCFSILLAIWGPVLASVSCLLTTVLVFAADILLGHEFHWISLLGCGSIAAGFAVLVSGDGMH